MWATDFFCKKKMIDGSIAMQRARLQPEILYRRTIRLLKMVEMSPIWTNILQWIGYTTVVDLRFEIGKMVELELSTEEVYLVPSFIVAIYK